MNRIFEIAVTIILLMVFLGMFSCKKDEQSLPVVLTGTVTDVTRTSASVGGEVTDDGGLDVTSRGFCWGTTADPVVTGNKTTTGAGTGTFSAVITDLSPSTPYYIRAYAINELGTAYGDQQSFTTGDVVAATLTTKTPGSLTSSSATSGGDITDDGDGDISLRGVCWNTTGSPTTNDSKTEDGSGSGAYDSEITGLDANTTYYARAYAVNPAGTAYGNEVTFKTEELTVTDIDGNEYAAVKIGPQIWMAENLATTKLNDGTKLTADNEIPLVTSDAAWAALSTPGYCWYDNDKEGTESSGPLYNWHAVSTGKLCPVGWHIPTSDEWIDMIHYLIQNGYNYDGSTDTPTSENKLAKATAYPEGWKTSSNTGAPGNDDYPDKMNATGFSARPAGYRRNDGTFLDRGDWAYWWSSSSASDEYAHYYNIFYNTESIYFNYWMKNNGYSVRCIKD